MKIAILGDTHFGMRGDSLEFHRYYKKFYDDVFFPYLIDNKIDTVFQLGDLFDRRKFINFNTLSRAKKMFFDVAYDNDMMITMIAGNHDTYFKNTNEVNSPDLLLKEYDNINVIDHPVTICVDETQICMMPWICPENYEDSMETLKDSDASICCGHFEIDGFQMYRGMPSHEGLSRDLFRKFSYTFSGHYHHKSSGNGIHYLGNPYELTWQDYDDARGFHIFDLDNHNLEFVENPNRMFYRISYDDKQYSINEISNIDFGPYQNSYVKVVVINKTNPYLFDKFMNNLYNVNPADITIVEDFSELTEGLDDEMVDQAEDTLTTLNKYIDSIPSDNIDGNKLKTIFRELYIESLSTN